MKIIGVDPGARGAIAFMNDGRIVGVIDTPVNMVRRGKSDKAEVDGYGLAKALRDFDADIAFVEQVGGITGQSASSAFNFGRAAGAVEYALKTLGVRVELVPPGNWRKGIRITSGKDGTRATASRMWPAMAEAFKRVKDDGRAEAALIAEFGRRMLLAEQAPTEKECGNVFG